MPRIASRVRCLGFCAGWLLFAAGSAATMGALSLLLKGQRPVLYRLLLLFTVVPLIELTLLIWLGDLTHWWVSVGLVIVTGILGTWLVRTQGLRAWRRLHEDFAAGRPPTESLTQGIATLAAGALLLTPGILTDALAILLLIPATRRLLMLAFMVRMRSGWNVRSFGTGQAGSNAANFQQSASGRDRIIDVQVLESPRSSGDE